MESNVGIRPNPDACILINQPFRATERRQAAAAPLFRTTRGDRNIADDTDEMTAHHVATNMGALALAEERGCWMTVASYIEGELFKSVKAAASPAQVAELDAAAVRLEAARRHEAIHGKRSLLDMDHWFNKEHLVPKPPKPGPTQTPAVKAILEALALLDAAMGSGDQNPSLTPSGPATAKKSSTPEIIIL